MTTARFEHLLKRYGDLNFRFSDTHGEMMTLNTYAKYIRSADGGLYDDSPLAIYDSEFGEDISSPLVQLTHEYSVPECFSPDLFALVTDNDDEEDDTRPPWRWILIGPERSGTGLHIDPLYTNAWVTVLDGIKRWMLFPPCCPAEVIGMQSISIPSVIWFRDYYEKVTNTIDWPNEWRPVEVLQFPGETVFVPNGWAHLVVNLGEHVTVAVTHNYASEFGPFERMWEQVVIDEPLFAKRWYRAMLQKRPDLAQRAKEYHQLHQHEEWTRNIDME